MRDSELSKVFFALPCNFLHGHGWTEGLLIEILTGVRRCDRDYSAAAIVASTAANFVCVVAWFVPEMRQLD